MPWKVRWTFVSWANSFVGTQSCATPPGRSAGRADPTRPWYVRVLVSTGRLDSSNNAAAVTFSNQGDEDNNNLQQFLRNSRHSLINKIWLYTDQQQQNIGMPSARFTFAAKRLICSLYGCLDNSYTVCTFGASGKLTVDHDLNAKVPDGNLTSSV